MDSTRQIAHGKQRGVQYYFLPPALVGAHTRDLELPLCAHRMYHHMPSHMPIYTYASYVHQTSYSYACVCLPTPVCTYDISMQKKISRLCRTRRACCAYRYVRKTKHDESDHTRIYIYIYIRMIALIYYSCHDVSLPCLDFDLDPAPHIVLLHTSPT